jgi:hypothetical protein
MPQQKEHRKRGSKKGRRKVSNERRGKYRKAFISCVKRTGKWRGKKKSVLDAR